MAALVLLSGCGGGGKQELQTVQGRGFSFSAPADWTVEVRARSSSAEAGTGDPELVSVTVFRLARPYLPSLWAKVVPELDQVAAQLASRLDGTVTSSATLTVGGRRARQYEIRYSLDGTEVVERTAFVLDGRREFQLLCRYRAGEPPPACDSLFETFRLG